MAWAAWGNSADQPGGGGLLVVDSAGIAGYTSAVSTAELPADASASLTLTLVPMSGRSYQGYASDPGQVADDPASKGAGIAQGFPRGYSWGGPVAAADRAWFIFAAAGRLAGRASALVPARGG